MKFTIITIISKWTNLKIVFFYNFRRKMFQECRTDIQVERRKAILHSLAERNKTYQNLQGNVTKWASLRHISCFVNLWTTLRKSDKWSNTRGINIFLPPTTILGEYVTLNIHAVTPGFNNHALATGYNSTASPSSQMANANIKCTIIIQYILNLPLPIGAFQGQWNTSNVTRYHNNNNNC